ncbi:DUF6994 family protein [Arthrobacter sp. 92]|uniref:DUF6994 family protein n=1 Tax=Arthrobacter sp. 92 TaxID=3418175 RepID=UPI003D025FF5
MKLTMLPAAFDVAAGPLECIRRDYSGEPSNKFGEVLDRYSDFVALFEDFDGYVEFFLLQDLINEDGTIRFFHPFDNSRTPAVPKTPEYLEYLQRSMDRIRAVSLWSASGAFRQVPVGPHLV